MRIYHPVIYPITMPTADELAALLSTSRGVLFPGATPLADNDAREFYQQFAGAFEFVATLRRVDGFQGRLGDWCTRAEDWHAERGTTCPVSLAPLGCAVLAAGDVPWQAPADRWPFDVFAGLSWNAGSVATPAWRDVLRTKTCRPMVQVRQERNAVPHPMVYHPGGS